MENKFLKVKSGLAGKLDLPRDVMLDLPKITIIGDNEVTIENHKGVVNFEDKMVRVITSIGLITINGDDFEILFMGGSTLAVSGKFESIEYAK